MPLRRPRPEVRTAVDAIPPRARPRGVRLGPRARETVALVTLVLLVVAVATVAHLASVAQLTMRAAAEEGTLLARQLFHQSARVVSLQAEGRPPSPATLRDDPGVRALLEGMVGYSRVVVYAALLDPAGRAVVHSDPALEGSVPPPHPSLPALLGAGPRRLTLALLGEPQIYAIELPMRLGEQAFATVRVGVSTSLVREELRATLVHSVALGLGALGVAVAVGLGAGRVLLEWLRRLARRVERLARGEDAIAPGRPDAMGELAERVDRLGAALRAELAEREPRSAVDSLVSYAQKLAALGRLTSGLAHEVRNPLNAMRIHLELLRTRLGQPAPAVSESLDVIAHEIGRLDRVVQGFLRFMRPQDLQLAPLDLNALWRSLARLTEPEAARSGVDVVLDLEPDLPLVTADAELVQQACANLLANAIQAMPKGGRVTLGTRAWPAREGRQDVEVRVQDQGAGIAPEDQDRIFRLYYTTKEGGSGIGLSIVYRIAQLHDGRIEVASRTGEGTTMTLVLPVNPVGPLE